MRDQSNRASRQTRPLSFFLRSGELDAWFHQRAGQDDKRNVARVFVAIDDQHGVVGFYSLSSFTLALTDLPSEHAKRLPRYDAIPAALIGRLARDERVRGAGVGDLLLADAVRRVLGAARSLAVFAVVVDAKDETAARSIATSDSRLFQIAHSDYSFRSQMRSRPCRVCSPNRRFCTRLCAVVGVRAISSRGLNCLVEQAPFVRHVSNLDDHRESARRKGPLR